jgi:hypothetical protein
MAATGNTLQPGLSSRRASKTARLPFGWPVYALFGGFPLWWALGLGELIWPILAVPMLLKLLTMSRVRLPRGFGWYALFMIWMLFSAMELNGPDRLIGFAYRFLLYAATVVILLFVYNAPKRLLSNSSLVKTMVAFWLATVAGGLAGLIVPELEFKTLAEALMPARLLANDFIYTMVHPSVAQVQTFLGYPVPRPKAPFVYTNDWGGTYALLVPFLIAGYGLIKTFWKRTIIKVLAVLSLLPVVFSLNRTLWLCLVITGVYGSFRLAARGKKSGLQGIVAVCLLFFFILNFGPTKSLIDDRVSTPHSNQGRTTLYKEAINSVSDSPLLGFGAPRPSVRNPNLPSVGTQGQFWLVLYSHGIPGALFFTGFLVYALGRGRRAKSDIGLWCHVCVLVAVVQMPFYGLLAAQLHVIMVAIALVERDRVEPDPEPEIIEDRRELVALGSPV